MKTLTKIDAFFTEADSRFALSGTYDNQTLTLFDGDTFFDEVDYCYSERAILTRTDTPLEEFYKLFQRWSEGKGYGFIRSYAALLIEYNPTHNYDGTETITTTTEFGKVVENESEGTTTNTPTLTSTTERSMYGYNSSTDVDADKAVTTAGGEDKTEASGSGSVTESGTETVTVETEKGGNLGLTTNAQLLTGELKLRMYDLQKEAIANFINEYTVEYIEVDGDAYGFTSSDAVYSAGDGIDITDHVISINNATLTRISNAEGDIDALDDRVTALEESGGTEYTAGDNITIEDGVISAVDTTYTAGANVSISENNVISATDTTYTAGDNVTIEDGVISATDTTYTAGDNVTIEDGVISATDTTYTAGDNVTIEDGVISATDTTYTAGDNITIEDGAISTAFGLAAYGTCDTASTTAEKVVTIQGDWTLQVGSIIGVRSTYTNTASNVTLNVNGTGVKSVYYNNSVYTGNSYRYLGAANRTIYYMYDGNYWCFISEGLIDTDERTSQIPTTTDADYEILFSQSADNNWHNEQTRKSNKLLFNPSTGNLQTTQLNGRTIGADISSNITATSSATILTMKAIEYADKIEIEGIIKANSTLDSTSTFVSVLTLPEATSASTNTLCGMATSYSGSGSSCFAVLNNGASIGLCLAGNTVSANDTIYIKGMIIK